MTFLSICIYLDSLSESSRQFQIRTGKLKKVYWWKNIKVNQSDRLTSMTIDLLLDAHCTRCYCSHNYYYHSRLVIDTFVLCLYLNIIVHMYLSIDLVAIILATK
jgi:hypothetical protein